jgi:hypothetical protein
MTLNLMQERAGIESRTVELIPVVNHINQPPQSTGRTRSITVSANNQIRRIFPSILKSNYALFNFNMGDMGIKGEFDAVGLGCLSERRLIIGSVQVPESEKDALSF